MGENGGKWGGNGGKGDRLHHPSFLIFPHFPPFFPISPPFSPIFPHFSLPWVHCGYVCGYSTRHRSRVLLSPGGALPISQFWPVWRFQGRFEWKAGGVGRFATVTDLGGRKCVGCDPSRKAHGMPLERPGTRCTVAPFQAGRLCWPWKGATTCTPLPSQPRHAWRHSWVCACTPAVGMCRHPHPCQSPPSPAQVTSPCHSAELGQTLWLVRQRPMHDRAVRWEPLVPPPVFFQTTLIPPPRLPRHAGTAWCLYPTLIADV